MRSVCPRATRSRSKRIIVSLEGAAGEIEADPSVVFGEEVLKEPSKLPRTTGSMSAARNEGDGGHSVWLLFRVRKFARH